MNDDNKTGCLMCSAEIVYTTESVERKCTYCGNDFNSTAVCGNDHFVCDGCHSSSALNLIRNTCGNSKIEDPAELAILLMKNPQLKMHVNLNFNRAVEYEFSDMNKDCFGKNMIFV